MALKPVRLISTDLKCRCNYQFVILFDDLPRPGLYICPECSFRVKITVEDDSELPDS